MDSYWQHLALIAGLILLNAFFAASEIAVVSCRPVRIRQMAEQGSRAAQALLRLTGDHSRFLATIQVGITLAGFLASASAAVGISDDLSVALQGLGLTPAMASSLALLTVTLGVSYVTLVLGELAPKRMALQAPERIALLVARPVEALAVATRPFIAVLTWSTNLVVRLLGGQVAPRAESISEEELRFYVEEHQELQDEEKKLIAGVFDLGDRLVRQVMVPRTEMACIHQDATLSEAIALARQHGYWRFPVYREDYDDIVGILTVKDMLFSLEDHAGDGPVSAVMRPGRFVPEGKRAMELLRELQTADEQMAIVVDEYGGVAGLVTLEDLLDEIVGDVGEPEPAAGAGGDAGEVLLEGSLPLDDAADQLNLTLNPNPHYETLAGYILHVLGAIPAAGDAVEAQGWRLVVEKMDGRRIETVRAIPLPAEPGGRAES